MSSSASPVDPDAAQRRAVLVTGASGRLGQRLVRRLHRFRPVVAVDRRPFPECPADVEYLNVDLGRKRSKELFRRPDIGALVHLGVMHDPRGDSEAHHHWNVVALEHLLEHSAHFGIPKVVILSSSNVYGPRPDNPQFLSESAPLLGASHFSEMRDLVELDLLAERRLWQVKSQEIVILRPANILGSVNNAASNYLRLKRPPTVLGFDPMIQAVHQDDVASALALALTPGIRGVFNIAGPAPVPLSRALQILGRSTLPLPYGFAKAALGQLFRMHISSFPAPELDFLRYVCMVDDQKARSELGYAPAFDLEATLRAVDEERW